MQRTIRSIEIATQNITKKFQKSEKRLMMVSLLGRPPICPLARVAARPALVRSKNVCLSAFYFMICIIKVIKNIIT